jgi:hypothetical protein
MPTAGVDQAGSIRCRERPEQLGETLSSSTRKANLKAAIHKATSDFHAFSGQFAEADHLPMSASVQVFEGDHPGPAAPVAFSRQVLEAERSADVDRRWRAPFCVCRRREPPAEFVEDEVRVVGQSTRCFGPGLRC